MGRISDKHKERRDHDSNPLDSRMGKTRKDKNDFDIDSDTIREQQNKK